MRTPLPGDGSGAGSGGVEVCGRSDSTPALAPQPEPDANAFVSIGEVARRIVADVALRTGRRCPTRPGP